ncbi:MAG: T9SS type A sorting domain-containing protein [Bacteroidota bacterium]
MKKTPFSLFFFLSCTSLVAQTTLISPSGDGGFETGATFAANGWTVVNDGTNQWHIGGLVVNSGSRGVYISNNGGVSNAYTISNSEVSHFYRDVAIPAGQDALELSFNYRGIGESGFDDLRVFMVPTTTTPVAGTSLAGPLGTYRGNNTNWFQGFASISCLSYAGTTMRLVFSWRNDATVGTQPPIAIDNIQLIARNSSPANDLPCSAQALSLSVPVIGDNRCAGSASEPGTASCWTAGNLNTVWYSVTCPASGQLTIRTNFTTSGYALYNTQIALYSGTCGSLTQVACNDNAPACGSATYVNSQITATGLTPGSTYFIRVDGANNLTGEFSLIAVDGSVGLPIVPGQDCSTSFTVCNSITPTGNPGYLAVGNICDYNGSGNCTSGERGAVWYTINISTPGNLNFTIIPNDYNGTNCTGETDYDFVLWKVAGTGATNCASILSSGGGAAVKCNFSTDGVTGLSTTGNAPAGYNICFDNEFETSQPVLAGEVYLLVVQNFSNSTAGFTLDFTGTTVGVINYAPPTSVNWTGGISTVWTTSGNWGGCTAPSCTVDGVVTTSSFNQPVLTTGTYTVRDLTINPGASLTINAGVTLQVCGNFTNNGSLIASPTSTIEFVGTGTQNVSGNFTGTSAFGNLTVNKLLGSVVLQNDIDVAGNFLTSNSTSVFNVNGQILRVAGNFTNNAGATTFTGVAGSTLTFYGSSNQNYSPGGALTLNNVTMNQSTPSTVTIAGANDMFIGTSGVLTLTSGQIVTGALEVEVTNTASGAVTAGNTNSFVRGNLRRLLGGAPASYDFPVGTAASGYQRANITFTTATTIPSLVAFFNNWSGTPPNGPSASECVTSTYNALQMLNNGYWTINASANPTSGNYDVTLYNTNYSNTAGAAGWTVIKDPGTGWGIYGTCVITSTLTATTRSNMNGFSGFGTGQAVFPLPVELLSFSGYSLGTSNLLEWSTASEINNDYFVVQRSQNGTDFENVVRVEGAGNSTQVLNYQAIDQHPFAGLTYYRLKQVDLNGAENYSSIIAIDNKLDGILVDNLYPNPTDHSISFELVSPIEGDILVEIYDMFGNKVIYSKESVKNGKTTIASDLSLLADGIYSLRVTFVDAPFISVHKVVKF